MNVEIAAAIFDSGKMTRRMYNKIRLLLKAGDADVLPPYKNVAAYRN